MEKRGALPTAASTPAIGDAFRLDINALRALSVVAVVGFHFQIPGFAGGFVGGVFAPTLFVGTMLGSAFGKLIDSMIFGTP